MSGLSAQPVPAKGNKEKVAKLISSVLEKVSKAEEVSRDAIYHELIDLQHIIEELRRDVGSVGGSAINGKDIPDATDELEAVVEATAAASGTIMDACDVMSEIAGNVGGDHGDAITEQVTKIFEACTFQDITGQRISKVVKTLKNIEGKVEHLVGLLGEKLPAMNVVDHKEPEVTGDEALLNGPQLPGNAISQDDIDRLLAEFDD